jgi:hypothetical protein
LSPLRTCSSMDLYVRYWHKADVTVFLINVRC